MSPSNTREVILIAFMMALPAVGCSSEGKGENDDTATDGEGGGSGGGDDTGETDNWRATGSGQAYLVDGDADNSLFTLELENTTPPRDGEHYYGWLVGGNKGDIALGEIPVTGDTLYFQAETGLNGLLEGYDGFEAWAGADMSARDSGDRLWTGEIDPALKEAYEDLILSNSDTPDGEGSVRTVETTAEKVIEWALETITTTTELTVYYGRAEAIVNALEGRNEDVDGNGTVSTIDGIMPILGNDGLVQLILSDLDTAAASVDPGHPIKDLANYAYDCTQRIESHADDAAGDAGIATVCGSEDTCDAALNDAMGHLEMVLNGDDTNSDGNIDMKAEGTIECTVFFVSQMAYMPVSPY